MFRTLDATVAPRRLGLLDSISPLFAKASFGDEEGQTPPVVRSECARWSVVATPYSCVFEKEGIDRSLCACERATVLS